METTEAKTPAAVVAVNLRRIREGSDVTQEQLAARSGVSRATIARLEGGGFKDIGVNTVAALAAGLGRPFASLLRKGRGA